MGELTNFSGFWGFLLVATMAGGVLGVLSYLASQVRNQQMVHDLKLEVVHLHSCYLKQLKEMREREQSGIRTGKESGKEAKPKKKAH